MKRIQDRVSRAAYAPLEVIFRAVEHGQLSRAAVLGNIPKAHLRGGGLGTTTYAEWCYTIGLFQTLIFENLPERPVRMLDVGCGVGRLYLAAKTYLTPSDSYLGIDVGKSFIDICQKQYHAPNASFLHTEASNAYYAQGVVDGARSWPIETGAHNLVTALSVWTHLNERDWTYYLSEVTRVLSASGRAIISFFILDELYDKSLPGKTDQVSEYYPQEKSKWIFDRSAYGSTDWFYPKWADVPEAAIGITKAAFDREIANAGLKVAKYYPGQWKDQPGFFFQDVVVFEKL